MSKSKPVTKETYDKIKKEVKIPADDAAAIEKYGYCASVIQNIRNTRNYQEYCERVFRFHGNPKGNRRKQIAYRGSKPAEYRREDYRPVAILAMLGLITTIALTISVISLFIATLRICQ